MTVIFYLIVRLQLTEKASPIIVAALGHDRFFKEGQHFMKLGIIGLPNSGKTTVFNALTGSHLETSAVSSGKLEVHTAVVNVPDARVDKLSNMYTPKKTTYATVVYNDVAGVDKGIGNEGMSGQLRNALSNLDGLIHVIRVFEDNTVPHPYETIDPARDLEIVDSEFLLSDLITVERRLERLNEDLKKGKTGDKRLITEEIELLTRLKAHLETEKPLRDLDLTEHEMKPLRGYGLLSLKPVVIVLNFGDKARNPAELITYPHKNSVLLGLQGKIEAEIAQLPAEDRAMFMEEYGISESGAARVIQASYELMHIMTFFTVGPDEVRAWSVDRGATAPEAAGVIHSDLQRGFIRAEVFTYDDLVTLGGTHEIKAKGKFRLEGKEYIVQDGDILNIRFNV